MSRSLRTRPMTLYQSRESDDEQSFIPPLPNERAGPSTQRRPTTAPQHPQSLPKKGTSSSAAAAAAKRVQDQDGARSVSGRRGAISKASEVGSNLKKRLSMRYAEPTDIDARGFSAIPDVPALPAILPGAPDMPPMAGPRSTSYALNASLAAANRDHAEASDAALGEEDGMRDMVEMDDDIGGTHKADGTIHAHTGLVSRKAADTSLELDKIAFDPMIDLDMLSSDKMDAERYLKLKLAGSSETFQRDFQNALRAAKEAASSDLKRQVFRNYQEFITISKEIATLENDMLELKELLGEWKTLPQALELEEAGAASFGSLADSALRGRSLRGNRNSMVDLQQIYKAQIQSLWENIEGSQKFLPLQPGRHLIAEGSSFTELNSATYKPRQQVALFLLNDLILVAVRKKRQMSARVRLVAERCFTLEEIIVIDLKDGGDLTNAIKIKQGKESFVYRTERTEDKRALLSAFRRVAEELANRRRRKTQAAAEARKHESSMPTDDTNSPSNGARSLEVDGAAGSSTDKHTVRALTEVTDQIAVTIAMREWAEAVTLVEQGQARIAGKSLDSTHREFASRLRNLTSQLVEAISYDLSSPLLKKTSVVRNVSFLLRLERGERAREIFLSSRSELLKRRSRQIKFEGDVTLYISELALVHFTIIKNTSEWYTSAFKDHNMASGFVRWAVAQIETYGDIFRRQVYGMVDQDPHVVDQAIEISMSSAAQLKEVGLDLTFILRELLKQDSAGQADTATMLQRSTQPTGLTATDVPSLTLTLADDPDEMAKRLSAIDLRRQTERS